MRFVISLLILVCFRQIRECLIAEIAQKHTTNGLFIMKNTIGCNRDASRWKTLVQSKTRKFTTLGLIIVYGLKSRSVENWFSINLTSDSNSTMMTCILKPTKQHLDNNFGTSHVVYNFCFLRILIIQTSETIPYSQSWYGQ